MPTRYADMTAEQKQRAVERMRTWRSNNKEKLAKKRREAHEKHYSGRDRDYQYRRAYGITLDDYDKMYVAQDGKCGICETETPSKRGHRFAVDHCHETLTVRGLLCITCNGKLGWFEKNSAAIAAYLGDQQ